MWTNSGHICRTRMPFVYRVETQGSFGKLLSWKRFMYLCGKLHMCTCAQRPKRISDSQTWSYKCLEEAWIAAWVPGSEIQSSWLYCDCWLSHISSPNPQPWQAWGLEFASSAHTWKLGSQTQGIPGTNWLLVLTSIGQLWIYQEFLPQ